MSGGTGTGYGRNIKEEYELSKIERDYLIRNKFALISSIAIDVLGFAYPIIKTISTNGKAYSPEEILKIGLLTSTASTFLYLGFDKINKSIKNKSLRKLESKLE